MWKNFKQLFSKRRRSTADDDTTVILHPPDSEEYRFTKILNNFYATEVTVGKQIEVSSYNDGESPYAKRISLPVQVPLSGRQELRLFVKVLREPENPNRFRFGVIREFGKELEMHHKVIPAIDKFQREVGICGKKMFFSKLMPHSYGVYMSSNGDWILVPDNTSVLLMDDIGVRGYKIWESIGGYDFCTAQLALTNLARMHATVLAMRLSNPVDFETKIRGNLFRVNKNKKVRGFAKFIFEKLEENLFSHPDSQLVKQKRSIRCALEYSQKHCWLRKHTSRTWLTMSLENYGQRSLLVKFGRKKDRPNEVYSKGKIVDFKTVELNSCAVDVAFFMFTSMNLDLVEYSLDTILGFYYICFKNTLEEHKIEDPVYSYPNFLHEFNLQTPKILLQILMHLYKVMPFSNRESPTQRTYMDTVRHILRIMIKFYWSRAEQ
ncbi:uncharacterized protein [Euwallacea similis]|uniref:uncharacterized protein n=1 Tax=Euwallacea similis TaxID=1736056 RepID=UPI00344F935C